MGGISGGWKPGQLEKPPEQRGQGKQISLLGPHPSVPQILLLGPDLCFILFSILKTAPPQKKKNPIRGAALGTPGDQQSAPWTSARRSLRRPYQGNPTFDPEFIRSKSTAAAGLCSWCINIVRFYEVYCDVAPKRQALEEANAELAEAQEKLSRIKNKIAVSVHPPARGRPAPRATGQPWALLRLLPRELGRPMLPHAWASPCFPRNSTPT